MIEVAEKVRDVSMVAEGCDGMASTTLPSLPDADSAMDALEVAMLKHGTPIEFPLVHRWTPGLYIREIFMPAGSLLTSKIHKTTHPFVISRGRASVWTETDGWVELAAGHHGITQPGTRRLLYIHEDTTWTTFHPLAEMGVDLTGVENESDRLRLIESDIIEPRCEHLSEAWQDIINQITATTADRLGAST